MVLLLCAGGWVGGFACVTDRCDVHCRVRDRWSGFVDDVSEQRCYESVDRRVRVRVQPLYQRRCVLQLWLQLCVYVPEVLQWPDLRYR
jgi:hypothetical protein